MIRRSGSGRITGMHTRELFLNIMNYGAFDRMPVFHWNGWAETVARWVGEGLPADESRHCAFLEADPLPPGVPINLNLFPLFEEEILEETSGYRLVRQEDGVIARHSARGSSIPQYVDYLLKGRDTWPEYQKRLQPDPGRIPPDLDAAVAALKARNQPVALCTGSMVGLLRNWMGAENFCITCCEDPEFVAEVADTMANLICWAIDLVGPKIQIDLGWAWEDICFRTGPLIQPRVFEQAAVPAYRKVSDRLRAHGCTLHMVDCDGWIEPLIPLWLEGGVNVMFPLEIGAWNADPAALRRTFGKEMRILGGIDKMVLEQDRAAIDAEIERRRPLMAEGGMIPLPDHVITPGTSLDNYRYYLDQIRNLRF